MGNACAVDFIPRGNALWCWIIPKRKPWWSPHQPPPFIPCHCHTCVFVLFFFFFHFPHQITWISLQPSLLILSISIFVPPLSPFSISHISHSFFISTPIPHIAPLPFSFRVEFESGQYGKLGSSKNHFFWTLLDSTLKSIW